MQFQLEQRVQLIESAESGVIVGRAEYTNSSPSYLIRYMAGDGRQVESWWSEDALRSA